MTFLINVSLIILFPKFAIEILTLGDENWRNFIIFVARNDI